MWVGEAPRRWSWLRNSQDLDTEDLGHTVKAFRLYLQLSGEPLNGLKQGWHYSIWDDIIDDINGISYFSTETDLTFIPLLLSVCLLLLWFVHVSPLHQACKVILVNVFGISMTPKHFSADASLVVQMVKSLPTMQKTWVDPWRWECQHTPVFLPRESHAQRSLVACSPWRCKKLDTTEWLSTHIEWAHVICRFLINGLEPWIPRGYPHPWGLLDWGLRRIFIFLGA